ncbi:MAG: oligosaccharide flippase family protein [Candidatus Thorarchaeota archaeon]
MDWVRMSSDNLTATAARGTSAFLTQAVFLGLSRVIVVMLLTRLMLQSEMGQVAIVGIIYGVMQFLGAAGLNHAAPRIVARADAMGDGGSIRSFLHQSARIVFAISLLLDSVLLVISPLIITVAALRNEILFLILFIAPLSSLNVLLDSFLMGRYRVRDLIVGRTTFELVRMTVATVLVLSRLGVMGVVIGWATAELAEFVLYVNSSTKGLPSVSTKIDMRPVLAFGMPSLIFQTTDVAIQNLDRVILFYQTDLSVLGVYDVLLGLLFMMSFVSISISVSLYPILTRVQHTVSSSRRENDALSHATSMLLRYVLLLLLPGAIIVAVNAELVLQGLVGSSYAHFPYASLSFASLIIFYVLWGLVYALHSVLRSVGESRYFWSVSLFVIFVEVVGCWYLTAALGLLGASVTRCFYITLLFLTAVGRARQRGVRLSGSLVGSAVRIGSASLLSGYLMLLVSPSGLLPVLSFILLSLAVTAALLFLLREIRHYDLDVVRAVVPSRLQGLLNRLERFCSS